MRFNRLLGLCLVMFVTSGAGSQELDFNDFEAEAPIRTEPDRTIEANIVSIDEVDMTLREAGILTSAPREGRR